MNVLSKGLPARSCRFPKKRVSFFKKRLPRKNSLGKRDPNKDLLVERLRSTPTSAWSPLHWRILNWTFRHWFGPPIGRRIYQKKYVDSIGDFRAEVLNEIPDPQSEPVLFLANHQSYMDSLLVGSTIYHFTGVVPFYMTSTKHTQKFPLGAVIRWAGAIPFDRDHQKLRHDRDHLFNQLVKFYNLLKCGHSLVIFPEGTTPGGVDIGGDGVGKLLSEVFAETGMLSIPPFILQLALAAEVKIVLIGLSGTGKLLPHEVAPDRLVEPNNPKDHTVLVRLKDWGTVEENLRKLTPDTQEKPLSQRIKWLTRQRLTYDLRDLVDSSLYQFPIESFPMTEQDFRVRLHYEREFIAPKILDPERRRRYLQRVDSSEANINNMFPT